MWVALYLEDPDPNTQMFLPRTAGAARLEYLLLLHDISLSSEGQVLLVRASKQRILPPLFNSFDLFMYFIICLPIYLTACICLSKNWEEMCYSN